jgi:hypothetical protein
MALPQDPADFDLMIVESPHLHCPGLPTSEGDWHECNNCVEHVIRIRHIVGDEINDRVEAARLANEMGLDLCIPYCVDCVDSLIDHMANLIVLKVENDWPGESVIIAEFEKVANNYRMAWGASDARRKLTNESYRLTGEVLN